MDLADGSAYEFSGELRSVKQWLGKPNEPMDALGLRLSVNPARLEFLPDKQASVSAPGLSLMREAAEQALAQARMESTTLRQDGQLVVIHAARLKHGMLASGRRLLSTPRRLGHTHWQ